MNNGLIIICITWGDILFWVCVSASNFVCCLFAFILILVLSCGSFILKDNGDRSETKEDCTKVSGKRVLLTSEEIFKSIQSKAPRGLHSFYIVKPEKMVYWMKFKSNSDLNAFHMFCNYKWLLQIITEARAQKDLVTNEYWVVVKIFKKKSKSMKFLASKVSQALTKKRV